MPNLPWSDIDTLLLDMDGTLLDLHFDNHFWLEHLPFCFAQKHTISVAQAKSIIEPKLAKYQGQLLWYCIDFWTAQLGLPIMQMKQDTAHLIALRPAVKDFLKQLRAAGKQLILATNAHPDALRLKLDKTGIAPLLDRIISSHQYGYAKEQQDFWHLLQAQTQFNPKRSLLLDDSLSVLHSAHSYGIAHTWAISQPDSQQMVRTIKTFPSVNNLQSLLCNLVR
ncbi:GMP/IMP nucleotidase [Pseudomonas sp. F1_0610]|uniref:GMP/IMP nucleotidase n=1 Tax=Pseudomonas sp. F1_0610 TaxID=3114284 RepID=UPI0039C0B892